MLDFFVRLLWFSCVLSWIAGVVCFVNFAKAAAKTRANREIRFSINPLAPIMRPSNDERFNTWRLYLIISFAAFVGQLAAVAFLVWLFGESS